MHINLDAFESDAYNNFDKFHEDIWINDNKKLIDEGIDTIKWSDFCNRILSKYNCVLQFNIPERSLTFSSEEGYTMFLLEWT